MQCIIYERVQCQKICAHNLTHVTKETHEKFEREEWEHPPYSRDLTPCDFHFFGPVKEVLTKRLSHADEKSARDVGLEFFSSGVEKLV